MDNREERGNCPALDFINNERTILKIHFFGIMMDRVVRYGSNLKFFKAGEQ